MNGMTTIELHRSSEGISAPKSWQPVRAPSTDDKAMLKAAADLTRDLNVARPAIYWADMIGSAAAFSIALSSDEGARTGCRGFGAAVPSLLRCSSRVLRRFMV